MKKVLLIYCEEKKLRSLPDLKRLHANAIIEYIPKKDSPQMYLLLNRVNIDYLRINMAAYEKRKQQFIERINKMMEYIHSGKQCRSQFIAAYFGDEKAKPCGIWRQLPETKRPWSCLLMNLML